MTDEGIVLFLESLYKNPATAICFKKLSMNKMFKYRSKLRPLIMQTTAKAVSRAQISEFYINNCKLKSDIQDFICGLFTNNSLEILDVSGNSCETVAQTLSKMLQHNQTLHTLYWDSNETSVSGLKSILLGLQRNLSIRLMPLPLLDIAALLKKENVDQLEVVDLTQKIQQEISIKSTSTGGDITPSFNFTRTNTNVTDSGHKVIQTRSQKDRNERRPTQQKVPGRKRKNELNLDISRAALVFGSISIENSHINSESPILFQNPPEHSIPEPSTPEPSIQEPPTLSVRHPEEQLTEPTKDKKLEETDTSTTEISEDKMMALIRTEENKTKKSPNRISAGGVRQIGKRVKKKNRSRMVSTPTVGIFPSPEKLSLLESENEENLSTSSSARQSIDTKE